MRTTDFSAAPAQARGEAMFIGATHYSGLRALLSLARPWLRMVRTMRRMDGYRWHKVYFQGPFTLGTVAVFADRDALLRFARSKAHRDLMCWMTDRGEYNGTAGFIRLFDAQPSGYSNGAWRAEGDGMAHIDAFTPIGREETGAPVHRKATS
ncbi:DUF4188 domain-containing protein [Embleya sp. AB8]|uniref:DUF4188 domain-containing protein n=1 Tax=Embleya sp. AB8 TaxID=3156304 RepID=UPI003C7674C2